MIIKPYAFLTEEGMEEGFKQFAKDAEKHGDPRIAAYENMILVPHFMVGASAELKEMNLEDLKRYCVEISKKYTESVREHERILEEMETTGIPKDEDKLAKWYTKIHEYAGLEELYSDVYWTLRRKFHEMYEKEVSWKDVESSQQWRDFLGSDLDSLVKDYSEREKIKGNKTK